MSNRFIALVMKKIISYIAYLWAGFCFLLLLSIFVKMESYQNLLMKLPFMKVDPLYTGGEIHHSVTVDSCTLNIHEPVFSALIGESKTGYIQVDIKSVNDLPQKYTIDYNLDKHPDFDLFSENGQFRAVSLNGKSYQVVRTCKTHEGWYIARISLDNPNR